MLVSCSSIWEPSPQWCQVSWCLPALQAEPRAQAAGETQLWEWASVSAVHQKGQNLQHPSLCMPSVSPCSPLCFPVCTSVRPLLHIPCVHLCAPLSPCIPLSMCLSLRAPLSLCTLLSVHPSLSLLENLKNSSCTPLASVWDVPCFLTLLSGLPPLFTSLQGC